MKLIAGDRGIGQLAVFADLGDDAADLVVLCDGAADGGVGDIRAVSLVQRLEDFFLDLVFVVRNAVGRDLERHIDERDEKPVVFNEI